MAPPRSIITSNNNDNNNHISSLNDRELWKQRFPNEIVRENVLHVMFDAVKDESFESISSWVYCDKNT